MRRPFETLLISCVVIGQAQIESRPSKAYGDKVQLESRPSKAEPAVSEEGFEVEEPSGEEEQLPEFTANQLERLHGHADGDKDGRLSLSEAVAHVKKVEVAQAFEDVERSREELDKDGDKVVTLEEYLAEVKAEAAHLDSSQLKNFEEVERSKFRAADENGDGVLHKEEIAALVFPEVHAEVLAIEVKESMRQKDKNGDGKLTINEFFKLSPKDEPEIWLTPRRRTEFVKLDEDNDGLISLEELGHYESGTFHAYEAIRDLFDVADGDGDLHLTSAELAAAKDKIASSEARHHLKDWVDHHEL